MINVYSSLAAAKIGAKELMKNYTVLKIQSSQFEYLVFYTQDVVQSDIIFDLTVSVKTQKVQKKVYSPRYFRKKLTKPKPKPISLDSFLEAKL